MHQAAALSLQLVDKGSWHAPRPGRRNIKRLQMEPVPSERGPESSKPSIIIARPTTVPPIVTRDE